ncbi:MAG: MgtC/SapB family protein [Variovorax sp.]|nr:MAG: MgtC/SapB family protein [Variovorax sp.]
MISLNSLELYWSGSFIAANALIGLNLLGALLLGMLMGYERSYNGRASGMRTYGLVCMASTALTVFVGYAPLWYGGAAAQVAPDATRVVQGVVTGVGFVCAGVIVKDGLNVSGLTTAASIWAASAVGVLLGVGLYAAAIVLAVLCLLSMSLVHEVERKLPGRAVFDVSLSFCRDTAPELEQLAQVALTHGYRLVHHSLSISYADNVPVWRFCVIALDRTRSTSPARLAHELSRSDEVLRFNIVPLKN